MKLKVVILVCMMMVAAWLTCVGLVGKEKLEVVHLDEDCRNYIERAVPAITTPWSYGEWKLRSTVELLAYTDHPKFQDQLRKYRKRFGAFREFKTVNGNVTFDEVDGQRFVIGAYTCRVVFRRGEADLAMKLVKKNGNWRFQTFSVRSESVPDDPEK